MLRNVTQSTDRRILQSKVRALLKHQHHRHLDDTAAETSLLRDLRQPRTSPEEFREKRGGKRRTSRCTERKERKGRKRLSEHVLVLLQSLRRRPNRPDSLINILPN